jgi:hypothetical protein
MTQFSRILPTLLSRTDVVLELRDARLPLTSVNRNFEGKRLRHKVVELPSTPLYADDNGDLEHVLFICHFRYTFSLGSLLRLLCKRVGGVLCTCGR